MEAIITAATVLTMYFNANFNANAQSTENAASQKVEYRYEYDEQGRLANKETLSWDEATKEWQKSSRLSYKYFKNGYNVEVSAWNANKQTYDLPSEVTLYRSQAPNLTTVKTYKMNETHDNMYLTSRTVVMEPLATNLLAVK
jgi:YD repeat-containing protein